MKIIKTLAALFILFCILPACSVPRQSQKAEPGKILSVKVQASEKQEVLSTLDELMATWGYLKQEGQGADAIYSRATGVYPEDNDAVSKQTSIRRQENPAADLILCFIVEAEDAGLVVQAAIPCPAIIENGDVPAKKIAANPNEVKKEQDNVREILRILQYKMELPLKGRIGIALNNEAVVTSMKEDGAAAKAGVKTGDRLLAIDGKSIDEFASLYEIVSSITGVPGSPVWLQVERDGAELEFTVERELMPQ